MIRRGRIASRRASRGWSLVELAVVLVVVGAIGVLLWRLLPLAPQVAAGDLAGRELAQAEQALVGHVLAHGRLPAPALRNGVGVLPVDDLGLPARLAVRYQVQPSLTVSPGDEFRPLLPPDPVIDPAAPVQTGFVNGLDFCMALKGAEALSLTGMDNIPTAFALMHGGPAGHEAMATAAFALPGSPGLGDRRVLAVGPGEFASRLGCPDRVARAHGAARAAYAAYDVARVANEYQRMRAFAISVAEMNLENAETAELFAGFDVAYGVFLEAVAILQEAAGWPPDGLAIATGIASHVTATIQLGIAISNLAAAVEDLEAARADQLVAQNQLAAANTNLQRMDTLASGALTHARVLDEKGLEP